MSEKIRNVLTHDDEYFNYGVVMEGDTKLSDWMRLKSNYKAAPPTTEQLSDQWPWTEQQKIAWDQQPPSDEYLAACKLWPYLDPAKQQQWEKKYGQYIVP